MVGQANNETQKILSVTSFGPGSIWLKSIQSASLYTNMYSYVSCPHSVTFGGRWCESMSVRWWTSPWSSFRGLAASPQSHTVPCRVTMPTGLGRGPGRQSALEAVSSSSVWQHANVCKWRGPAMTPAHRRNGPCPSQQRTQDGGYTAQHTHIYICKHTHTHTAILQYPVVAAFTLSLLYFTHIQNYSLKYNVYSPFPSTTSMFSFCKCTSCFNYSKTFRIMVCAIV